MWQNSINESKLGEVWMSYVQFLTIKNIDYISIEVLQI